MSTIMLAYSGGFRSSVAVHWLAETSGVDVVTVTVDVGQGHDLGELRGRAMSCGAVRAHAIDARDELAREFLLPSLGSGALGNGHYPRIGELVRPMIARKLLEIARIEGARTIAHGALETTIDEVVRALDPTMQVLAPARLWRMDAGQLSDYARARGVAPPQPAELNCSIDQNLWGRMVSWPDGDSQPEEARPMIAAAPTEHAHLDIHFDRGIPVSVNGVSMSPVELVESLALIAGRHGVGRLEAGVGGRRVVYDAPAAVVLHAARAAADERGGVVRIAVRNGQYTVMAPHESDSALVDHA